MDQEMGPLTLSVIPSMAPTLTVIHTKKSHFKCSQRHVQPAQPPSPDLEPSHEHWIFWNPLHTYSTYFTADTSLSTPMGNKLKKSFFKVELPHQMSFQNLTLIPAPAFNPPANSSHAFPLDFRNPTIYWP